MDNNNNARSSAGIWWTIIIIILIIVGIVIYSNSNQNTTPATSATQTQQSTTTTTTTVTTGSPMIPYYTLQTVSSPAVGIHIVANNGMTLYMYSGDSAGVSNCTGACATAWPPYTVSSSAGLATMPGMSGTISTLTRANGTLQVTYKGTPLYFFQSDTAAGETSGENVGGFTVVTP